MGRRGCWVGRRDGEDGLAEEVVVGEFFGCLKRCNRIWEQRLRVGQHFEFDEPAVEGFPSEPASADRVDGVEAARSIGQQGDLVEIQVI